MNKGVATATGASLSYGENWHAINWPQVYRNVRRLQTRIVKAVKAGKKRRVRALRNILTCSFSGQALAIKRVSSNQGKRTPGVDQVILNTPKKKAQALRDLRDNGYQPLPLKRVYLRKRDGMTEEGRRDQAVPRRYFAQYLPNGKNKTYLGLQAWSGMAPLRQGREAVREQPDPQVRVRQRTRSPSGPVVGSTPSRTSSTRATTASPSSRRRRRLQGRTCTRTTGSSTARPRTTCTLKGTTARASPSPTSARPWPTSSSDPDRGARRPWTSSSPSRSSA